MTQINIDTSNSDLSDLIFACVIHDSSIGILSREILI